jgi:hypothetical protein
LVDVDAEGDAQLRALSTDVLRWRHERVAVTPQTTKDELGRLLAERIRGLAAAAPGWHLLVHWEVHGEGPLLAVLRRGTLAAELLASLRAEFGHRSPAAWSVSLEVAADSVLPAEWFGQKNLLGDFLNAVSAAQASPATSEAGGLDLATYLGPRRAQGVWGEALALDDDATRRRVLQRAAALGADLLSGDS